MPTRPFPIAIDSTMLGSFRSCPIKMYRSYMEHWKPVSESVHLIAGGSFADGIEAARRAFYEEQYSADDLLVLDWNALITRYGDFECPPDSAKSLERTAGALEFYFANYPLGADGAIPITSPMDVEALSSVSLALSQSIIQSLETLSSTPVDQT
jgi:hypothetical protein